ncbi:MAG: hypothetical protein L0332_06885 [Chloroflexi bacterium]|nr:hypothetical protein [Chloroflexota bacterium]
MRIDAQHPLARHARVWLNGFDVTSACTRADSDEGWVELPRPSPARDFQVARYYGQVKIAITAFKCPLCDTLFWSPAHFAAHVLQPHFSEN